MGFEANWTAPIGASVLGALLLATSPANRAQARDCNGLPPLADDPVISYGKVASTSPRTFFVAGASERKGCPSRSEACRLKAFLVPGDGVLAAAPVDGFVCTEYLSANGETRDGWLPETAVKRGPSRSLRRSDWIGTWSRTEATITVKAAAKAGFIALRGDATYGSLDPDRVKRGAVNVGEFEGVLAPNGDRAALPVDKASSDTCHVWMRRVGPTLVVDDNNLCGGFNVTFRGTYTRRP